MWLAVKLSTSLPSILSPPLPSLSSLLSCYSFYSLLLPPPPPSSRTTHSILLDIYPMAIYDILLHGQAVWSSSGVRELYVRDPGFCPSPVPCPTLQILILQVLPARNSPWHLSPKSQVSRPSQPEPDLVKGSVLPRACL